MSDNKQVEESGHSAMLDKAALLELEAKQIFYDALLKWDKGGLPARRDSQINALLFLSETLHNVRRMPGSIGYKAFHHAAELAQTLDCAIGNLRRLEALDTLLTEIRKG